MVTNRRARLLPRSLGMGKGGPLHLSMRSVAKAAFRIEDPPTDLMVYKAMLDLAGEEYVESEGLKEGTTVTSSQNPNTDNGSFSCVIAYFDSKGALKAITPEGCTWDCDHCRE